MLVYSHFYSISRIAFVTATEFSLSNLMKIVTESFEKFTDSDLEEVVDVWNRKGRQIAV